MRSFCGPGLTRRSFADADWPIQRYLFAEHALDVVPPVKQPPFVAGQRKIDDVVPFSRIQLAPLRARQQVIDLVLQRSAIGAAYTAKGVVFVPHHGGVAIRAAQEIFETIEGAGQERLPGLPASLAANRRQGSAQPVGRVPLRAVRVQADGDAFHDPLRPTALRDEHIELVVGKMPLHQRVPTLQISAVVLADAEAFFLIRADHVAAPGNRAIPNRTDVRSQGFMDSR